MNFVDDQQLEDFLKNLSNETKRKVMFVFFDGKQKTVNEIAEKADISQSTASEYLSQLKRAGLLLRKREGKEVTYQPDREKIQLILKGLADYLGKCC